MQNRWLNILACFLCTVPALARVAQSAEPTWKAGWDSAVITPQHSMWMAGFGNRTQPSDGTLHELRLKILALEDAQGQRAVLMAADLLGIPKSVYDNTCAALQEKHGLERSQIMLNSSHTHNSPVLRGALLDTYPLDDRQLQLIEAYSSRLERQIVTSVGRALGRMVPVRLSHGEGTCNFSFGRESDQPDELVHNVPVLAVRSPKGKLRAVVLTYACHPTSLKFSGWGIGEYVSMMQKWSPDFPQFAVERLEAEHASCLAMFTQGCGGDRGAPQQGQLEKTREIGFLLAAAVQDVLDGQMQPIEPRLQTAFQFVELPFGASPTREHLEAQRQRTGASAYLARWSGRLLEQLDAGQPLPNSYPEFPVQVWRLGEDHIWVSLGGETVSGYSVAIRDRIAPGARVLGYTNDVMCYIPTPQIIRQGGYVGQSSMAVYGVPAMRWSEEIEERILSAVEGLLQAGDP